MEIVVNRCFGGFGLSTEAVLWARERNAFWAKEIALGGEGFSDRSIRTSGYDSYTYYPEDYNDDSWRSDPILVECVKVLGKKSWGSLAKLQVVAIPDDVEEWFIDDYDGQEHVSEAHRTW